MGRYLRKWAHGAIKTTVWTRVETNRDGDRVKKSTPLPTNSRFLLVQMADHVDDVHGTIWAGDETIAKQWVFYGEAWVRKARGPLVDTGLIELVSPARKGVRARWQLAPQLYEGSFSNPGGSSNGRTPRAGKDQTLAAHPVHVGRTPRRDGTEGELNSTPPPKGRTPQ